MAKTRVGVLFGGRSGEHEVSLLSAASVIKAIDKSKYDVVPIGITKGGQWVTDTHAENLLKGEQRAEANPQHLRAATPTKLRVRRCLRKAIRCWFHRCRLRQR